MRKIRIETDGHVANLDTKHVVLCWRDMDADCSYNCAAFEVIGRQLVDCMALPGDSQCIGALVEDELSAPLPAPPISTDAQTENR